MSTLPRPAIGEDVEGRVGNVPDVPRDRQVYQGVYDEIGSRMNDVPQTEVLDWWLKHGLSSGIGVVFTATVLLGLLWVSWALVRILTARLPAWFDDQAITNSEVRKGMQALVEHTKCIHDRTHATQRGLRVLAKAGEAFLAKNGERLGVSSDVVRLVKRATVTLSVSNIASHHDGDEDDDE